MTRVSTNLIMNLFKNLIKADLHDRIYDFINE